MCAISNVCLPHSHLTVRDDLLGKARKETPSVLDYTVSGHPSSASLCDEPSGHDCDSLNVSIYLWCAAIVSRLVIAPLQLGVGHPFVWLLWQPS